MARKKLINLHGKTQLTSPNIGDNTPLQYGEIAINYSNDNPSLYIRKEDDTIATFSTGGAEYTLVQGTPETGMAAEYHLTKNGTKVGASINIPKDQFLKSVSYDSTSKELVFIFETSEGENELRVSVTDLVDIYTAGSGITITNNAITIDENIVATKTFVNSKLTDLKGKDIPVGTVIGSIISADTKIDVALQALNDKISGAISGGLTSVIAGNGISVSPVSDNSQTISTKIVNENGLSVDTNGIQMALASEGIGGAIKSAQIGDSFSANANEELLKVDLTNGILTIQVSDTIDCGTYA